MIRSMKKRLLLAILMTSLLIPCGCEKETANEKISAQEETVSTKTAESSVESTTEDKESNATVVDVDSDASDTASDDQSEGVVSEGSDCFVNDLEVAEEASQILIVSATGNSAVLTLYNKNEEGLFEETLSADASIGKNGIGKTKEGDKKTPKGKYAFTMAFGLKDDPGSQIPYTKLNDSHYWIDDSNSKYYNQFVSTKEVKKDWSSAEDLYHSGSSYNYALAINYNEANVPGLGSAIFMHCRPTGGLGCIAVDESVMKRLLKEITPECILIIDTPEALDSY